MFVFLLSKNTFNDTITIIIIISNTRLNVHDKRIFWTCNWTSYQVVLSFFWKLIETKKKKYVISKNPLVWRI